MPEFIPQFLAQASTNTLGDETAENGKNRSLFRYDRSLVLRLPTHKTFYVVSCEVCCDRLGLPALINKKLPAQVGVIRRIRKGKEYSWMMASDEPLGWEETATGRRDPMCIGACAPMAISIRENVPLYWRTNHPLHVQVTTDDKGKKHTLLYGYVALGGQYIPRKSVGDAFDATALSA